MSLTREDVIMLFDTKHAWEKAAETALGDYHSTYLVTDHYRYEQCLKVIAAMKAALEVMR